MRNLVLLIFISFLFGSISYACSCSLWEFDELDEMFYGKVISVHKNYNPLEIHSDSVYIIEIEKKWKGNSYNRMKVYDIYSCGYGLRHRQSNEVIVYAIDYSTLAERLYPDYIDEELFEKLISLGLKKATTACFYYPRYSNTKYTEFTIEEQIAYLDSVFTKRIPPKSHYYKPTNLVLIIGFVFVSLFYFNKRRNRPNSTKQES